MSDKKCLNILDIGSGPGGGIATSVFAPIIEQGYDYKLCTLDIDPDNKPDIVHDIRTPLPPEMQGKFDLVLASHVLEHIERNAALDAFRNMVSALAMYGELWVIVPSLEWCAEKIMNNQYGIEVMLSIYGNGAPNLPTYHYHNMGYTLPVLRDLFKRGGLVVRKAYQSPFTIEVVTADGKKKEYIALQNIMVGVRLDNPTDGDKEER